MSKSDLMHKQELAWQGAADMKVHEGETIACMRNGAGVGPESEKGVARDE